MILLIFVKKWRQNDLGISDRLLGYYPILISSQHLKTVWRRLLTAVRCEWWNGATGFAIPFSVFDPLPRLLLVSHEALLTKIKNKKIEEIVAIATAASAVAAAVAIATISYFFFLFFFFTFLFNQEDKSMLITVSSGNSDDFLFFSFFFSSLHFFLIKKISPCLSPYAWSEGTPIIISAWYTSDIFPVSALWTGERQGLGAVFIPLKINAKFFAKCKHWH